MAMTLCWAGRLNASSEERTTAGRRFDRTESVNGNGTITTSNGLELAIGFLVEPGGPFAHRGLERFKVLKIPGSELPQPDLILPHLEGNPVATIETQGPANRAGDRGLVLCREP